MKSLGDVSVDQDLNRRKSGIHDTTNFIGTSCETLHLSTFGSSCEKLAKLHSPFQMAHQKVKMKLSPIPYYLKVVGISTQRSPIINTVSQTLMFQIRGVSIASQCVAVPDASKLGRVCQLWSSPHLNDYGSKLLLSDVS